MCEKQDFVMIKYKDFVMIKNKISAQDCLPRLIEATARALCIVLCCEYS